MFDHSEPSRLSQGPKLSVRPSRESLSHHVPSKVYPPPEGSLKGRYEPTLLVYLIFHLLHPTISFLRCHSHPLLEESSRSFLYIAIPLSPNLWITSPSWKVQLYNIYKHRLSKEKSC